MVVSHYFFILSIIPVLVGMGFVVMSCIGRWLIFSCSGYKGFLSLIPVINVLVYGEVADRRKSAAGLIFAGVGLSLSSAVLGKVYVMTGDSPALRSQASIACLSFMAILSLVAFVLYIRLILGVCSALMLNRPLFLLLTLFFLPVSEFAAGIIVRKRAAGGVTRHDDTGVPQEPSRQMGEASSLEAYLDGDDEALALWDSGALIVRDGVVINTACDDIGGMDG